MNNDNVGRIAFMGIGGIAAVAITKPELSKWSSEHE